MGSANLLCQIIFVLLLCSDDAASCREGVTITTPSPMTALKGSCLKIPCTYEPKKDINPARPVTGIWTKNKKFSKPREWFSVSGDSGKSYPMNITGNLKAKDCTTMFRDVSQDHEDKYYFRVENSAFRATAVCTHLQITVTDSAWSPSIEVSGNQTENEVVTITCSAVTPCPHAPPQLTWDLLQGTVSITETNSDGTVTTKSKLNITLTDSHDGQTIKCSAVYPVSGEDKMADSSITLSVTYGPKDTSVEVSPSGSLSVGQSVTLSCSSRANPPVHNFTWFTHSSQGPVSVGEGHTYNFSVCDGGDYYCEAANALGYESSPVTQLRITDAPWSPSIEVSGNQTENEVVTIICSAVTPCPDAPPQLTWDLHQGTVNIGTTTGTNPDGTITTETKLNITLTDSHDGQMIKCSAAYPVSEEYKITEDNIILNVTYGPKDTSVEVSPSRSLSAGQSVTLNCSSRANPPVHNFTWFTHSSQGPVSQGRTYNFNLTEDGHFYCVALNALGNESSQVIHLTVKVVRNNSVPWEAIVGAVIGVLTVIFLVVFARYFKTKYQARKDNQREAFVKDETIHYGEIDFSNLKPKETSSHEDTELKEETVYSQIQVSQAKPTKEETVHYAEINFSTLSPKVVPVKEVHETVYSEVHVSKSVNNGRQFSDGADSLYANVKKN